MHTDEALLPQLQWERKIIRLLVSHHEHWNGDFGNNYNFRTGPPDTYIPHEIMKIYATFVLTTTSEGVKFATNMDASAIYCPNFWYYSTSPPLQQAAPLKRDGQLPAAKRSTYVCTSCVRNVEDISKFHDLDMQCCELCTTLLITYVWGLMHCILG
jgi:hypothetical protein